MVWTAGQDVTAALLNANAPQEWTSYTPTLGGTGTTQGNATRTGAYCIHGDTVVFWAKVILGSTSVIGSTVNLSLPVSAVSVESFATVYGRLTDSGTTDYLAGGSGGTTTITLWPITTGGTYAGYTTMSATVPFTWVAGDVVSGGGVYQRA